MVDLSRYLQQAPEVNEDVPEKIERSAEIKAVKEARLKLLPKIGTPALDVGAAGGWTALRLKEMYSSVVCLTLFEEEAKALRERGLVAHVSDMHCMPEEWSNFFGVVHASNVLEHSPAPYIAMCEFQRVLKLGGVIQVVMPNADGYLYLGSEKVKRLGSMSHHLFCCSTETVIEMFRHVGIRFDGYYEYPVWSLDRPNNIQRVWMGTKVKDRKEAWRLP